MTWYGTELDHPRLLVVGSFLLRPIRAEDAPADHAALMDSRSAVRVHTGSDWPPDDFSEEADRLDLERDAQRHDAREAFTFTVVDAATGAVAGCLYLWPARHQLIRYGVAAQDADRLGSGAAAVELWLRPRLVTAGVDEQMVRAVRAWLDAEWRFPRVVWLARRSETRYCALLDRLGLRRETASGSTPDAVVMYA